MTLGDVMAFVASVLILGALGALIVNDRRDPSATLAPIQTVVRFERVIDGRRVQCERREDHVRDTVETAC